MALESEILHRQSIVIDGHCDTLLRWMMEEAGFPPGMRSESKGHIDLERLKAGGITAQNFACYVPPHLVPQAAHVTLRMIDLFYRKVEEHPTDLCLATCAADIEQAKAKGQVAGILSIEGTEGIEGDLALLRMLYRLGVRWVGITWSRRNMAADGVYEARTGGGLTNFGVQLVEELNRLGMIVDVAHLSPAGVRDVLAVCQGPVVASHANARALCDNPRNLSDEQLEGIARSGGVVGVVYVPEFITDGQERTTLDMLIDHIDHMVKTMGIDHVGLGSDFDGFGGPPPTGLEDVSCTPHLTARLLERGYAPNEVSKILGGNWLRVIRRVVG